jgi:hypothetical protein
MKLFRGIWGNIAQFGKLKLSHEGANFKGLVHAGLYVRNARKL